MSLNYLLTYADNAVIKSYRVRQRVVASQAIGVLDFLVGLECREENRPFSGQQHQAQFGLNPALQLGSIFSPLVDQSSSN